MGNFTVHFLAIFGGLLFIFVESMKQPLLEIIGGISIDILLTSTGSLLSEISLDLLTFIRIVVHVSGLGGREYRDYVEQLLYCFD